MVSANTDLADLDNQNAMADQIARATKVHLQRRSKSDIIMGVSGLQP